MWTRRQSGATLVELIIAMVILGVALGGLIAAQSTVARSSADPMVAKQLAAVSEGIMEEILLKPYASAGNAAPSPNGRDTFNDVRDFSGYQTDGVYTIEGVAIDALSRYRVEVLVEPVALTGIPSSDALQIRVTVSSDEQKNTLTAWRSCYAGPPCN